MGSGFGAAIVTCITIGDYRIACNARTGEIGKFFPRTLSMDCRIGLADRNKGAVK